MLAVDRLDDGEGSPYLTDVLIAGDELELRGPIGGYFTWEAADGGPLFLVGGGSGVAPLMAMIRHRAGASSNVPTRLLYSSRSYEEIIYREELENLAARDGSLEVIHTLTCSRPEVWSGYHRRIDASLLTTGAALLSAALVAIAIISTLRGRRPHLKASRSVRPRPTEEGG